METSKKIYPASYNVTDHYKFIPFVVSSESVEENKTEFIHATIPQSSLNGEEISQFYNKVVSSPSTSLYSEPKKDHVAKKNRASNVMPENNRLTIFHHAQNGNIEGIKYFLSRQYFVDIQDMYGWTPLMCATFEGHYDVVEYLIKCGAQLNVKNKQGLSALDIAVMKNNKSLVELFNNGSIDKASDVTVEVQEEMKYCDLCNISYLESTAIHEKSIAHLFSSRDDNVSTYYHIPENNKGFQIMLKRGWDKNKGLGINATGRKYPVKTVLKTDRTCIGGKKEVAKVTHFGPNDYTSIKKNIQPTLNLKKETKLKKKERELLNRKNCQLEINFRRQFNFDN